MRGSGVPGGGFDPDDEIRPTGADATPSGRGSPSRDPLDVELDRVWHTKVEPMGGWASRADTAYQPRDNDMTGPNRLDDELRGLSDTRSFADYEEGQGGIERRYGDDEL
jgi:hypothetical protein